MRKVTRLSAPAGGGRGSRASLALAQSRRRLLARGLGLPALVVLVAISGCASGGTVSKSDRTVSPRFGEKLAGTEARAGLLTFHVDRKHGRIWLELPAPEASAAEGNREGVIGEFLYVEGLVTGLGSNPIGLDRGQLGPSRVVVFRRLGNRVLVEERNLGFRAISDDSREQRATRESFANSVLWAGTVEEETSDGTGLVDFTSFLVRDAHGVVRRLQAAGQGSYRLDEDRSAVDFSACLAFPDNLEFEALLTFASDAPGGLVAQTAPSGEAFGLVQHHSLIRLPGDGYRPRVFDPRAGSFSIDFQDYAAPLAESIEKRWIVRHRLSHSDPDSQIVYYVDSGAPEPVRTALIEGASWWSEAFAAAGFPGAFRVEVLPDDVHPLDARYNVIQWVHRSTRGWSYGGGVIDPRTGEMIKGHVSLGSLRVRQDRLIFEGLLGTRKTGSGEADDPIELALARIRQLAAHEVGHTLGFAHNFAASSYGRASVMDYPAPWVHLDDAGNLDVSQAYSVGVGAWDLQATRYAYAEFADPASEAAGLDRLIRDGLERGLLFLSDQDARAPGAAQSAASLWDNGADAAEQLVEELDVRRVALARFGLDSIAEGAPMALLEEVLATVYFRHRYQLEAAVKRVGGLEYSYALAGDGQPGVTPVSGDDQRRALEVVLSALALEVLDLPESVLGLLAPRPFGYSANREMFSHRTAPAFDAVGAAETAADLVVSVLLQPERAARLVDQARRRDDLPGFDEVLGRLIETGFEPSGVAAERYRQLRSVVEGVIARGLIALAADGSAAPSVRAEAEAKLREIRDLIAASEPSPDTQRTFLDGEISRFLGRTVTVELEPSSVPAVPPGSPIGASRDCSMAQASADKIKGGLR